MKFNFFRDNFSYKIANRFLFSLLALDFIFIITHVLLVFLIYIKVQFDWSISKLFMVNNDGSFPELFQYLKYIIIIISIIYIMLKEKIYNFKSWLFLFVLLCIDDAFRLHEQSAIWIVEKFGLKSMIGLRPEDIGELIYAGVIGLILLIFLILDYYNGNYKVRKTYIDLGMLFGFFIFFGIGIDLIHQLVGDNKFVLLFIIILEDGGEMIALSLITWYFYFLSLRTNSHNAFLYQYLFKKKN